MSDQQFQRYVRIFTAWDRDNPDKVDGTDPEWADKTSEQRAVVQAEYFRSALAADIIAHPVTR